MSYNTFVRHSLLSMQYVQNNKRNKNFNFQDNFQMCTFFRWRIEHNLIIAKFDWKNTIWISHQTFLSSTREICREEIWLFKSIHWAIKSPVKFLLKWTFQIQVLLVHSTISITLAFLSRASSKGVLNCSANDLLEHQISCQRKNFHHYQ